MALASFTVDPGASALTPNDIISMINSATDDITRAGSVDPTARPIEDDEVTSAKIADGAVTVDDLGATAVRDSLDAMADIDRGYIKTRPAPASGDFKVLAFKRLASGLLHCEYDDVPV